MLSPCVCRYVESYGYRFQARRVYYDENVPSPPSAVMLCYTANMYYLSYVVFISHYEDVYLCCLHSARLHAGC